MSQLYHPTLSNADVAFSPPLPPVPTKRETARMMRDRDRSFPKDLHEGVYVPQVTPGSPAEAAGFRPGDVIVSFGGEEVRRGSEIIQLLGTDVGRRHQAIVVREHGRRVALYVESEENVS